MRSLLPHVAAVALAAAATSRAQGTPPSYPFRDLVNARSMGMGNAYRALGLGLESVVGNPAAMSLYPRYDMELSGAWDLGHHVAWGTAGVMDSAANRIALGAVYHLVSLGDLQNRSLGHLNSIALSTSMSDFIFVGLAVHYLYSSGALRANAVTGDAGVLVRLLESITVGVSGHYLIGTTHAALAPYFSAEAAYSAGLLSACLDVRAHFQANAGPAIGVNAGGEYILGEAFPVRAGWSMDEIGSHFISAGGGYMFPGGGIDVAYRHELSGVGRTIAVTIKLGS